MISRTKRERRRFELADGLILIAGLAFGFTMARTLVRMLAEPGSVSVGGQVASQVHAFGWVLVGWGGAIVVAEWRKPGGRRRTRYRRPGIVLAATSTIVVLLGVASAAIPTRRGLMSPAIRYTYLFLQATPYLVAPAITSAWLLNRLAGARGDRDWIDRLGRLLGVAWIVELVVLLAFG